jgi:hypothetical protein
MSQYSEALAKHLEALPNKTLFHKFIQEGEIIDCALTPYTLFGDGGKQTKGVLLECLTRYRQIYFGCECKERVVITEAGAKAFLEGMSLSRPIPN